MNVQIIDSKSTTYTNLGRYFFIEMVAGNHRATVSVAPKYLQVIVQNASNRAWRGMGRQFRDLNDACAYYKTPEIRAMLRTAVDAATLVQA